MSERTYHQSLLHTANFPNAEGFFLEINLRKKKRVISFSYNPNNQTISSHRESLGKAVDSLSSRSENFLITGDFHAQTNKTSVEDLCNINSLKPLIKEPTYYKNSINPKCIDLVLTNR